MNAHEVVAMPLPDRLFRYRKIQPNGCWEWTGSRFVTGYGRMRWHGEVHRVSRLAAAHWLGLDLFDRDTLVCHSCDNPPCFNPEHLFLGSQSLNMRDMVSKGRHGQKSKTHCTQGHEFNDENTQLTTLFDGEVRRSCRTCSRIAGANYRARRTKKRPPNEAEVAGLHFNAKPIPVSTVTAVRDFYRASLRGRGQHATAQKFGLSRSMVQRIVTGSERWAGELDEAM